MTKRKSAWLVVLIIVVALIVVVFMNNRDSWFMSSTPSVGFPEGLGPTASQLKSGTAAQTKTYTQLVTQYKGKHFQFDINCQMVPSTSTFKNGTSVMFDNRSGDARKIVIDGKSYSFPGYGYKVITLSNAKVPYTVNISKCGAAVNVGSILLQK